MADLSVNYAGLRLKNPLICASGPPTDTVERCVAAAKHNFAAVVLKSIMHRGAGDFRYKHAVPRFKVVDRFRPYERWTPDKGIDNMAVLAAGEVGSVWTEEQYGRFVDQVKQAVGDEVKVAASLMGPRNPQGYDEYFELFSKTKADFIEIDFGYARYYKRLDDAVEVIKQAKKKLSVPVTVKMYPFLTDPMEIALVFQNAGADGLTMFDAAAGLDFDINGMKLPFRNTWSFIAPGVTLPYTNLCIAGARLSNVTISLSASFGVWQWEDVIKCIMSGADAVQLCRRIMVRGYKEANAFLEKINAWLDQNGYKSIEELRGKVLGKLLIDPRQIPREEPIERGGIPSLKAAVDKDKCQGCVDLCTRGCLYFANRSVGGKADVDDSKCGGCGMCEGICPYGAISLVPRVTS